MSEQKVPAVAGLVQQPVRHRECQHCGDILMSGAEHSICGDCFAAYKEAMRQDEQRAEWHAEMRRDAFGA